MHTSGEMPRRYRRPSPAPWLALSVLLLGACTSEGSANPGRPPSEAPGTVASPSHPAITTPPGVEASASRSPTPTVPDAAASSSSDGAIAFVRYFFDVYDHAFWNADEALLKSISDPDCVFCKSAIAAVHDLRSRGERIEGGRITVIAAAAAPTSPADRTILAVRIKQEAARTISAAGEVEASDKAEASRPMDVAVRWTNGHWILLDAATAKSASPS